MLHLCAEHAEQEVPRFSFPWSRPPTLKQSPDSATPLPVAGGVRTEDKASKEAPNKSPLCSFTY